MQRADVVVIGGGLAGLSVGWNLAGSARVVVLEQGAQPGEEASAQNAGMMRRLAYDRVERQLALRSAPRLMAPGEDWQEAPPYRVTGGVLAFTRATDLYDAAVADVVAHGVAVESVHDDPGAVAPALAGAPVERAWFVPDEGLIDAHALPWGFVRGIRRQGSVVTSRTEVMPVVEGGRVVGVQTHDGEIAADVVVVASGAWSPFIARQLGLERPLTPLARHLLVSAAHGVSRPDHPWTWIEDVGVYVRPEAGGWLCSPCDETASEPNSGPGSRGPVDPWFRAMAVHKLETWLPALGDVSFVGGWTGLRTFCPDRRPMLGADPEVDGLWWATGLGGFGVTCCHAAGEAVADLIVGNQPDWLDIEAVAPGRAFETGFVPGILPWGADLSETP